MYQIVNDCKISSQFNIYNMKQRYKYFEKITELCLFNKMKQMHNTYVSTMFKIFMKYEITKYSLMIKKNLTSGQGWPMICYHLSLAATSSFIQQLLQTRLQQILFLYII